MHKTKKYVVTSSTGAGVTTTNFDKVLTEKPRTTVSRLISSLVGRKKIENSVLIKSGSFNNDVEYVAMLPQCITKDRESHVSELKETSKDPESFRSANTSSSLLDDVFHETEASKNEKTFNVKDAMPKYCNNNFFDSTSQKWICLDNFSFSLNTNSFLNEQGLDDISMCSVAPSIESTLSKGESTKSRNSDSFLSKKVVATPSSTKFNDESVQCDQLQELSPKQQKNALINTDNTRINSSSNLYKKKKTGVNNHQGLIGRRISANSISSQVVTSRVLSRSTSSLGSLPKRPKSVAGRVTLADYSHVGSKVKEYIESVKKLPSMRSNKCISLPDLRLTPEPVDEYEDSTEMKKLASMKAILLNSVELENVTVSVRPSFQQKVNSLKSEIQKKDEMEFSLENILKFAQNECRDKLEIKKVLDQLQSSYVDLQKRYAIAENTIDQLRFGSVANAALTDRDGIDFTGQNQHNRYRTTKSGGSDFFSKTVMSKSLPLSPTRNVPTWHESESDIFFMSQNHNPLNHLHSQNPQSFSQLLDLLKDIQHQLYGLDLFEAQSTEDYQSALEDIWSNLVHVIQSSQNQNYEDRSIGPECMKLLQDVELKFSQMSLNLKNFSAKRLNIENKCDTTVVDDTVQTFNVFYDNGGKEITARLGSLPSCSVDSSGRQLIGTGTSTTHRDIYPTDFDSGYPGSERSVINMIPDAIEQDSNCSLHEESSKLNLNLCAYQPVNDDTGMIDEEDVCDVVRSHSTPIKVSNCVENSFAIQVQDVEREITELRDFLTDHRTELTSTLDKFKQPIVLHGNSKSDIFKNNNVTGVGSLRRRKIRSRHRSPSLSSGDEMNADLESLKGSSSEVGLYVDANDGNKVFIPKLNLENVLTDHSVEWDCPPRIANSSSENTNISPTSKKRVSSERRRHSTDFKKRNNSDQALYDRSCTEVKKNNSDISKKCRDKDMSNLFKTLDKTSRMALKLRKRSENMITALRLELDPTETTSNSRHLDVLDPKTS